MGRRFAGHALDPLSLSHSQSPQSLFSQTHSHRNASNLNHGRMQGGGRVPGHGRGGGGRGPAYKGGPHGEDPPEEGRHREAQVPALVHETEKAHSEVPPSSPHLLPSCLLSSCPPVLLAST